MERIPIGMIIKRLLVYQPHDDAAGELSREVLMIHVNTRKTKTHSKGYLAVPRSKVFN